MARMFPSVIDASTVSNQERRLFSLLEADPDTSDWCVLHSLRLSKRGRKPYGEIDFVVLLPGEGIFCLEVKGGRVACENGTWTTTRGGETHRLNRSPFLQAREGMFALREAVESHAPRGPTTGLLYGYAVVLPDVSFTLESPEWERWQIFDCASLRKPISVLLRQLAAQYRKLHSRNPNGEPSHATLRTVLQFLRPNFDFVVTRGTQIEQTEVQLTSLTQEQFVTLDTLADNERCLTEGAAGTGKTMLALEYARRSALVGKRTILLCFNRLLGEWLTRQATELSLGGLLKTGRYYQLLREVIVTSSIAEEFRAQERGGQSDELYESTYRECGMLAVEDCDDRYDVLVMDEAQDLLRPAVLDVLNIWLKGGLRSGQWAIFGDFQRQAIFRPEATESPRDLLARFAGSFAKGRLTLNCRNTRNIGEETALLSGFSAPPYRMGQVAGLPVDFHYFRSKEDQCTALRDTLIALLKGGVRPAEIVVISPLKLANSGVFEATKSREFRLKEIGDSTPSKGGLPVIQFATVQAFKGMESAVVVLCDIERVTEEEPQALLYVAMSRARSQLTVLVHERARRSIGECVRRKLQDEWVKST